MLSTSCTSAAQGGRIAPLGAFPHARMETEDPISAETGPTLQTESESVYSIYFLRIIYHMLYTFYIDCYEIL